jgi:hypothetical protein
VYADLAPNGEEPNVSNTSFVAVCKIDADTNPNEADTTNEPDGNPGPCALTTGLSNPTSSSPLAVEYKTPISFCPTNQPDAKIPRGLT